MSDVSLATLADAVARNAAVVLALPSAGMLRNYPSRFLLLGDQSLLVESVPGEARLLDELRRSGMTVTVTYKAGQNASYTFTASVLGREPNYSLKVGAAETIEALRLEPPREVKLVQRRMHYRVNVPAEELSVSMWMVDPKRPDDRKELKAEARDLSLGGMGITLTTAEARAGYLADGERVGVELRLEGRMVRIEGYLRFADPGPGGRVTRCGIQWTGLQQCLEGRRTLAELARMISWIERYELRRARQQGRGLRA